MSVYTIPPSCSFADALAAGLLHETQYDPALLATYTILLPNRRAVRSLREAFLRLTDGAPLLLPTIRPLGDVEEDGLWFQSPDLDTLDLPPAMPPLERQLTLARLLQQLYGDVYPFEQALSMAASLAAFIDSVHTEGLSFDALDTLVEAEYAAHWNITLTFLNAVIREHWPRILAEKGYMDAGLRRRLLMERLTDNILKNPPIAPYIAAGSTGSIPATAALIKAVAETPQGRVILPGLDCDLDDISWGAVTEPHPQATLKNLLQHMGIERRHVKLWPFDGQQLERFTAPAPKRDSLISAIMRPAETVGAWAQLELSPRVFDGLTLLEADTLDEEAGAIAVFMRQHIEDTFNQTPVILVTPDRTLAARVAAHLYRWGIVIDDSAGVPLSVSPIGQFLVGLAKTLASGCAPVPLLATLKHPLCQCDAAFVLALDAHILRGVRPAYGVTGLMQRLSALDTDHPQKAVLEMGLGQWGPVLQTALHAQPALAELLACAEALSHPDLLWAGDTGEAAALLCAELLQHISVFHALSWADIADILSVTMAGVPVRPRFGTHPRLSILGPMEARLQQAPIMILGSLNEGTWPQAAPVDAWMSRPMRQRFGLPAPERGLTLSAHDFCQGLGAQQVFLTRSKLRDGAATIPSRWLQRLDAVRVACGGPDLTAGARVYIDQSRRLDEPMGPIAPQGRPRPCPPVAIRPRSLSVTEIGKWQSNPYGIFAKHVLKLRALDPLDATRDKAELGQLLHKIFEIFTNQYPTQLPPHALDALVHIGRGVFDAAGDHPDIQGHWWPRFTQAAQAVMEHEKTWRANMVQAYTEQDGILDITLSDGTPMRLRGRADRIERTRTGGWTIIDYKSGTAPTKADVEAGREPQLPLLGWMLQSGAFDTHLPLPAIGGIVETLGYWPIGKGEDAFKPVMVETALCADAADGFKALCEAYLVQALPYICCPDPDNMPRAEYNDYAHLARIKEWSGESDDDEVAVS